MIRSQNHAYEFSSETSDGSGRIAVLIGLDAPRQTSGYLLPQPDGTWKIQVEGEDHPEVFRSEHEAADEIYRLHRQRTGNPPAQSN